MSVRSQRHLRHFRCIDSADETAPQHNEDSAQGSCPGLSPPSASSGIVLDENTVVVTFDGCVVVSGTTGIEYRVNIGVWTEVAGYTEVAPSVWSFDVTPTAILAGDVVEWRYVGGYNSIQTCDDPAEDIGAQGPLLLNNPLVVAGDFILLETGGADIVLVEEDTDGSAGVQTEEAP